MKSPSIGIPTFFEVAHGLLFYRVSTHGWQLIDPSVWLSSYGDSQWTSLPWGFLTLADNQWTLLHYGFPVGDYFIPIHHCKV